MTVLDWLQDKTHFIVFLLSIFYLLIWVLLSTGYFMFIKSINNNNNNNNNNKKYESMPSAICYPLFIILLLISPFILLVLYFKNKELYINKYIFPLLIIILLLLLIIFRFVDLTGKPIDIKIINDSRPNTDFSFDIYSSIFFVTSIILIIYLIFTATSDHSKNIKSKYGNGLVFKIFVISSIINIITFIISIILYIIKSLDEKDRITVSSGFISGFLLIIIFGFLLLFYYDKESITPFEMELNRKSMGLYIVYLFFVICYCIELLITQIIHK